MIDTITPSDTPNTMRSKAEERARLIDSQPTEQGGPVSREELQHTVHELQVHQIELEMQNDELRRTQADLAAAQAQYQEFFDLAPVGYLTANERGIILDANITVATLVAVPKPTLIGRAITEFIYPEDQDIYYHHRSQLSDTRSAQSCELRLVRTDGKTVWTRIEAAPTQDDAGQPLYRIVVSDISEPKLAEERTQRNEHLLRLFVEHSPAAIAMFDRDMRYIAASHRYLVDYDLGEQKLIGRSHYEVFPEISDRWKEIHRRCLAGETERAEEDRFPRVSGKTDWVRWEIQPWFERANEIGGIVLFSEVITESKQAQEELRESENNFRTLAEAMPQMVWITRPDGGNIYFNQRWMDYTGLTLEESHGDGWNKPFHPDDQQRAWLAWENATQHGTVYALECRLRRKDGVYRWWLIRGVPVIDANGTVLKWFGTCTDIDDLMRMEQRLRQSEKMDAIGQLAGGIAHDFNNVLGGIIGYTDLSLGYAEKGSMLEKNLLNVLKAAERAKNLVKQILTFSRQGNPQKSVISVRPIITEVLELLRASIPSSVIIETDLARNTKAVYADPTKIHEVLLNLANNAVHAMDRKGRLTVRLCGEHVERPLSARTGEIQPGEYTVIEVADTGTGMDVITLSKAFEPFFTTKPVGEGTGMGLSVVLGVVKSHDGEIQVESEVDKGTAIRIFLPVTDAHITAPGSREQSMKISGTEHILFVDDEQMLVEMSEIWLTTLGYTVTAFTDSREALNHLKTGGAAIDLLITDQTMPNMTGMELAAEALKLQPELPIILCMGYSSDVSPEQASAHGIGKFLLKPYRSREIGRVIRELLDAPHGRGTE